MGNFKAPGLDDFPGSFYKSYWSTVQGNINVVVSCFYNGEFSVDSISRTNIVLIPKIPHPESMNQFWPISLCNSSIKILSKLLANILKCILPLLISEHQNAFVLEGQIQDNLILAHEAYHYLKLKNSKSDHECALKLDMNKAYDRVEWDFLEVTMLHFGFDEKWVMTVMRIVSSISFSIQMNGKEGQSFRPTRGLRQGDPLSPYLFLLVGEVLSKNVMMAVENNSLKCLKLSANCPGLSYLLFADDSLFFFKATTHNC
ncbi:hypothetical protein ACLB2K_074244 [Fragaria x ananassa]